MLSILISMLSSAKACFPSNKHAFRYWVLTLYYNGAILMAGERADGITSTQESTMISDKYLFTPHAKDKWATEPYLHLTGHHCPKCDAHNSEAEFLEETGGMGHTVVMKCKCGTIYNFYC